MEGTPKRLCLIRAICQLPLTQQMQGLQTWVVVAEDRGRQQAVAAAALQQGSQGGRAWVEVLPHHRHQGIGSELTQRVLDAATRASRLEPWRGVSDADGSAFCRSRFSRKDTVQQFETSIAVAKQHFGDKFTRLSDRGRVPAGVSVVINEEVPLAAARTLLGEDFGPQLQLNMDRIAAHGLSADEWMLGLWFKGELVAVGYGRFEDDAIWVDAYAVAPAYRGVWAAVAVRHHAFDLFPRQRPLRRFCFLLEPSYRDTVKLAQRLNAKPSTRLEFFDLLQSPQSSECG